MRIPMSWLREYTETQASTVEITERLTVSSLEVERVTDVGVVDEGGNLGHFVVGRVVSAEPHPNADRLQLCQVDVGNADPQQIVCGAWNFGAGATVAVGLPGALLPGFPTRASRSSSRRRRSRSSACPRGGADCAATAARARCERRGTHGRCSAGIPRSPRPLCRRARGR